ncbi:hypothetical protein ASPZODRAFT_129553 [Penicilliopsis zonata CBS 506.65]|uniref:Uncharacterized protein n=1 Tax=Penicilliopsis zonata CBS 506.65 TaxID=1073090 RepID=A0A1L9SPF6_9EURO|nr:hypothetical protein ASPZODRAFT_129553 [Penicilliopsis zonata CBS 506.65]OJJ49149.1 hypothetical protein ASPZODRAFT_129553 [Penicilliopsis zonata CBS 506.65]
MAADFWAGYLSGAVGIVIGNPLDLLKVRLQAGHGADGSVPTQSPSPQSGLRRFESGNALVRGAAAPILGYGALNALLFVAYNRSLMLMDRTITDPTDLQSIPLWKIWLAGAAGGLASWGVSSPTELIKCRAQLSSRAEVSSWKIAKEILHARGFGGLYYGGAITSIRDSVGYGFYFWSYEYCKRYFASEKDDSRQAALKVLLCGGIAGIVTWASVFPLDVVKTRLQAQPILESRPRGPFGETRPMLDRQILNSFQIAKQAYRREGWTVFYRGLGICSVRAFIVNAVQWATYEWLIKTLNRSDNLVFSLAT